MRVDYKYLRDLNDIFHHRGNAHVIVSLATRPMLRYSEIAPVIIETTGELMVASEINRCLKSLEAEGVLVGEGPRHHRTYRLTGRGRARAALLTFILAALEQRDGESPPAAGEPSDRR